MSKNKPVIIGISGVARSGKDTFCQLLISKAAEMGLTATRLALADELKAQIRDMLITKYGIDVLNCTPEEKEVIRPELVQYGKDKRIESQGTYWTGIVTSKINSSLGNGLPMPDIMIVPDIRYEVYERDEAQWVKDVMNGVLVHVSRYAIVGGKPQFVQPPNEDERVNDPLVQNHADWLVKWPTKPQEQLALEYGTLFQEILQRGIERRNNG